MRGILKVVVSCSLSVLAAGLAAAGLIGGGSGTQFGDPLPGLSADQLALFTQGKTGFQTKESAQDGLGPVFNEQSCATCHGTPATGGSGARLETRFGRSAFGVFDPLASLGGSLMQDHAIDASTGYTGTFVFVPEVVPPQANVTAQRRTTPLFGFGLVEAVPDDTLTMLALMQAGSPTAGRTSQVTNLVTGKPAVGRFGWKAQVATLFDFAGDAYLNEMGVTTPLFPNENCPQGNCAALAFDPLPSNVPNDSDNSSLDAFAAFMRLLAPPPRGPMTFAARAGADVFRRIGCASCHHPVLQTGPNVVPALDRVTFAPFSDFLLHDMGSLGDGIAQADAGPREMRTAPLWGVSAQPSLLHDGRATTLEGAILAHDGQARDSRNRFNRLGTFDRQTLIAFLKSL
jgi:CxxC motif-containing protein (DUF1111 family)